MSNTENVNAPTEQEVVEDPVRDYIGYVKWFDDKKGYGFVRILTQGDRYEEDVFVHQSNIHPNRSTYRTLRESETVRFNLSTTDERPQVTDLVGVNGRLYCDSRVPKRRNNQRSRSNEEEGGEWKTVGKN